LRCRQVSKSMKEAVDKHLSTKRPPWLRRKTRLVGTEGVRLFQTRSREFIGDGGIVSTLLTRNVEVHVLAEEDAFLVALDLLKEHGKWIKKLEIAFSAIGGHVPQPRDWIEMLIECLKHVPKLQFLKLRVQGWNDDEANRQQWERFVPPPVAWFPHLTSLMELELDTVYNNEMFVKPPTRKFFQSIMEAYGPQLFRLRFNPFLFSANDCLEIVTRNTFNLRVLEMCGDDCNEQSLSTISQLYLPHLSCFKVITSEMDVNEAFSSAIQPFRSNLTELFLSFVAGNIDTMIWNNRTSFPNLKKITVRTWSLEQLLKMWEILNGGGFTSLEEIRIKPFWDDEADGEVELIEGLFTNKEEKKLQNPEENYKMKQVGKREKYKHVKQLASLPNLKVVSLETYILSHQSP